MAFLCPDCSAKSLIIAMRLELAPDSRWDEITLQTIACASCGFRGVAVYRESRRGALPDLARAWAIVRDRETDEEQRLRVFERGVGETMACGTGACAAVAVGIHNSLLDHAVQVELKGGCLTIRWQGDDNSLYMTGPAQTVYKGKMTL